MTSRILTAIFICPPLGIGSGVVTELFFKHERAQKMGWWTLMTTLGTPMGPFIMGFIVQHLNVNWIFSILAIINFCQFLGYLLLDTETLYHPSNAAMNLQKSQGRFTFSRIDKTPFSVLDCVAPFYICRHLKIVIPACAYALVFCYANIAIIVEMPIIFGEKFGLDPQSIGLQYIALIIGSVLGEQLSGPLSDAFLNRYSRRTGHSHPVHRLWISYVGFLTVILGILVWGIQLQHAKQGVWNVTPLVGAAIASFGNQIITTTIITFAVDNYREESADIGVIVNFIRQVWGFVSHCSSSGQISILMTLQIGPFYFPLIFGNLGFAASAGIFCSIIFAFGCLPVVGLHVQGRDRKPAGEVV
jgi:MFS family permease